MSKKKRTIRDKGRMEAAGRVGRRTCRSGEGSGGGSGRGRADHFRDDAELMVWRIKDWRRLYEPDPIGLHSKASVHAMQYLRLWVDGDRAGTVSRREVEGRRKAIRAAGGYELRGFREDLLIMAANKQRSEGRGYLTDFMGRPLDAAGIAAETDNTVEKVSNWLELLSGPYVAFLEHVSLREMQRELAALETGSSPADQQQAAYTVTGASDGGASSPDGNFANEQDSAASWYEPGKPPPAGRPDDDPAANAEKSSIFLHENEKKSAMVAVSPSKRKRESESKSALPTACGKTALSSQKKNDPAHRGNIVTGKEQEKEPESDAAAETEIQHGETGCEPPVAAGAAAPDPGRTDAAGGPMSGTGVSEHAPNPGRPPALNKAVWQKLRKSDPLATWGEMIADNAAYKLSWAIVLALGLGTSSARNQKRNQAAISNAWLNAMALAEWTESEQLELFEAAVKKAWALNAQQREAVHGKRKPIEAPRVWMYWWKKTAAKAAVERLSQYG